MTKAKILILEDEDASIELLKNYIQKRKDLSLAQISNSTEEALKKIKKNNFDLAFVDINLQNRSGLEFIKLAKNIPYFIITSTRKDKAIEGLNFGAIDYLLKPIYENRFKQSLERFLVHFNKSKKSKKISVIINRNEVFIEEDKIIYLEIKNKYLTIFTEEKIFSSKVSPIEIQNKFIQIQKSILLNKNFITSKKYLINGKFILTLNENIDLELNRSYAKNFKLKR